jgi:hypothetical protein
MHANIYMMKMKSSGVGNSRPENLLPEHTLLVPWPHYRTFNLLNTKRMKYTLVDDLYCTVQTGHVSNSKG